MGCQCGTGAPCTCVIEAGAGVTLAGSGTFNDPWVVSAPADCDTTMACVGAHAGDGLTYTSASRMLSVRYSTTTNNLARAGVDGGVYVPPPVAGPGLSYNVSTREMAVRYSADPGNTARGGVDGGVFVPTAGAPGSVAIATADTATVDISGDGTSGAPLSASVKPDSLPISIVDTATVDLAGDGTTTTPLSATVKAGSYPVSQVDTAEVNLTGDGTAASPLKADLTGTINRETTVNGNLNVRSGNISVGGPTDTVPRNISGTVLGGADRWSFNQYVHPNGFVFIILNKNEVLRSYLGLSVDGQVEVYGGGTARPYPFAIEQSWVNVTVSNAISGSAVKTLAPNRFTVQPIVYCSPTASGDRYHAWWSAGGGTTSTTISVRHIDNIVGTATVTVNFLVVQMLHYTEHGRAAAPQSVDGLTAAVATCHTQGCGSEGLPLEVWLVDEHTSVWCGGCDLPIEDVSLI